MPRTLYARLALGLFALLLVVGGLYAAAIVSMNRHYEQEVEQRLNLDLARRLVEERRLVVSGALDREALKATFSAYMAINPSIEIYLLDRAGRIEAYSADPDKVKRRRVGLAPIRAFLAGDRLPVLGDDPRSPDQRKIFSVTPIPDADDPEAYLYVVLRGQRYDEIADYIRESLFWRQSLWALAGSLAVGLLAGLLLFRRMTARLRRLRREMEGLRRRDFASYDGRVAAGPAGDEIDDLAATFDAMARRIVDLLEARRRQDRLRRDLVANVSHDLRTPVAILDGQLETLRLKAGTMDAAEREACLEAALRASGRLVRLIDDLFELARLDTPGEEPEREPFNVAELAQDVLQKFEPTARAQGVALRLEAADTDAWVCADIGQISRVFENLIGNALAVTRAGSVCVRIAGGSEGIGIAVVDTGPGIPDEELAVIFDRFYQGSTSHGGPGGLGLAIASRIVALHGHRLEVESHEGRGSRFHFVLPAAADCGTIGDLSN